MLQTIDEHRKAFANIRALHYCKFEYRIAASTISTCLPLASGSGRRICYPNVGVFDEAAGNVFIRVYFDCRTGDQITSPEAKNQISPARNLILRD